MIKRNNDSNHPLLRTYHVSDIGLALGKNLFHPNHTMAIGILVLLRCSDFPEFFSPRKKHSPRSGFQKQNYNNGPFYFLMKMSMQTTLYNHHEELLQKHFKKLRTLTVRRIMLGGFMGYSGGSTIRP